MKYLYAPWRSNYMNNTARAKDGDSNDNCVFCIQFASDDDTKHYILKRYERCAIMLNLYPYNAGHLLIVPYQHTGQLDVIYRETRTEMMDVISHAVTVLHTTLGSEGTNIGINLGKIAGAGLPFHVHAHALPRWHGDTNFLPTLAGTKSISFDLNEIYQKLKSAF